MLQFAFADCNVVFKVGVGRIVTGWSARLDERNLVDMVSRNGLVLGSAKKESCQTMSKVDAGKRVVLPRHDAWKLVKCS